jgi:hypothetical protein
LLHFFQCRIAKGSRRNGDCSRESVGCGYRCFALTPSLPLSGLICFQCVVSRCERRHIISSRRWLRCGVHRTHTWQRFGSQYGGVGNRGCRDPFLLNTPQSFDLSRSFPVISQWQLRVRPLVSGLDEPCVCISLSPLFLLQFLSEVVDRVQQSTDHDLCYLILFHEVCKGRIGVGLVQTFE